MAKILYLSFYIVADKINKKGIVKQINNISCMPEADKYIFAFEDNEQLINIRCKKPFLYCTYPDNKLSNLEKELELTNSFS